MPPEERNSLAERYINAVGRDALLGTEVDYHAVQMQNGVGVPESEGIGKNNAAQALKSVAHQPKHSLTAHQRDRKGNLGKGPLVFFDTADLTERLQKARGVKAPTKGASTSSVVARPQLGKGRGQPAAQDQARQPRAAQGQARSAQSKPPTAARRAPNTPPQHQVPPPQQQQKQKQQKQQSHGQQQLSQLLPLPTAPQQPMHQGSDALPVSEPSVSIDSSGASDGLLQPPPPPLLSPPQASGSSPVSEAIDQSSGAASHLDPPHQSSPPPQLVTGPARPAAGPARAPAAARLQRRTGAGRLHAAGRVGRAPAAAAPLAAPKLRELIAAARGLGAQRDDERARRRQSVEAVEALQQKAKQRKAELERRCKGLQELVLAASMDIKKLQAQAVAKRAADAQRSQAARRKQDELNEQARQLQFEEDTVAALTAKISELQSELERREDEAMGAEREAMAAMDKMQGNLDAITDQVKELTRKLGEAQAMESRARAETVAAQEAENAALDAEAKARAEAVTAAAALQVAVDRERHAATAARAEAASRAEAEAAHRTLATESAAERGVIEATFRKEISVMEGEQQVLAAPGGPAAGADPAAEAGFAQTAVPGAVGAENLTLGRRLADDIMFQLDDSRVVVLGKALGKGEFGSVVQAVIYEEGSVHWRLVAAMCDLTDDITAHGFEQLLSVRPDQPDQGLLSRVAEVAAFAHGQVAATTSQLDVPGTAIAVKRFFEEKDYSKEVLVLELRAEREAAEEASQLGSDLVLRSIFVDEPTLSIGFELAASDLATILLNENGDPWGLPNAEARLLCAQVCRGVAFLHKLKIAHRDLKPANLLLTIDRDAIMRMCDGVDSVCNFVKIGDLGLCVDLVNTDHMDRDGTPFWMPPEVLDQAIYAQDPSTASPPLHTAIPTTHHDEWSVGMIILDCLLGDNIFVVKRSMDELADDSVCDRILSWREPPSPDDMAYEEYGASFHEFRDDSIAPKAADFPYAGDESEIEATLEVAFDLMASKPADRINTKLAADRLSEVV